MENNFDKLKIPEKIIDNKSWERCTIVNLDSWNTFKQIFDQTADQWVFRGQDNSNCGLSSSLYRANLTEFLFEQLISQLLKENEEVIKDYGINFDPPLSKFEWLCIQQHYGMPTRLLDWTKSPYIAAWFACFPASIDHINAPAYSAIWAINKGWCKYHAFSQIKKVGKYSNLSDESDLRDDNLFQDLFLRSDLYLNNVLSFVYPFEIPERIKKIKGFERMDNQKSIFLCAGNDKAHFVDNLCSDADSSKDYIVKFIIKNKDRKSILDDLKESKSIDHKFLFNSFDQYAQYIIKAVIAIDKRDEKTSIFSSAYNKITSNFTENSWKPFFKIPEQLVFKDNFPQLLLESDLDISQKITLLNIWRDSCKWE